MYYLCSLQESDTDISLLPASAYARVGASDPPRAPAAARDNYI